MSGRRHPLINGKAHTAVVLRALEWDEQGRPSKVVVGYDDTSFRLAEQSLENEFWIAFVSAKILKPTGGGTRQ